MKAVMKIAPGVGNMALREIDEPEPGPKEPFWLSTGEDIVTASARFEVPEDGIYSIEARYLSETPVRWNMDSCLRVITCPVVPAQAGRRRSLALPLDAGQHEIEVTLAAPKELAIDWRGARQCNYRATAAVHRSSCVLEEKGGAVVDNPAFVESGETTIDKSRVVVRQIP